MQARLPGSGRPMEALGKTPCHCPPVTKIPIMPGGRIVEAKQMRHRN